MKRFRFRLERILRYKEQVEEEKNRTLSVRNTKLKGEKGLLLEISSRKDDYSRKYGSLFRGKIDIYRLKRARRFLDKLHFDQLSQTERVEEAKKNVQKAKAELLNSMRDRKKYDNLRKRKKMEYDYEANREEQKEYDEFASRTSAKQGSLKNRLK